MVEPAYTVKALDESTWPAFAALVERNNGIFGGCWCMGFHEDNKGTVPPKRERKLARVRAGTAHAALVFDRDDLWAGVSSVHLRKCRASRTAPAYEKDQRPRRTGGSRVATSARDTGVRAWHRRARRCARSHRGPGRGDRRGISGGRRSVPQASLHGAFSTTTSSGSFGQARSANTAGSWQGSSSRLCDEPPQVHS